LTERTKNERIRSLIDAKLNRDVPYLADALSDPEIRTIAARYLGDIGAEETAPMLMRLLSVSDPGSRSAATKALTKLRATEALPDLVALARTDPSAVVRSHAIGALGRLGEPSAVIPVILEALQDTDGGVSACAAEELGSIADFAAIEPIQAASSGAHFLRRGAYRRAIRRIRKRGAASAP